MNTKVKELIEELQKQPQDADVVIWEWTANGALLRHAQILLRPYKKEQNQYLIGPSEHLPPIEEHYTEEHP